MIIRKPKKAEIFASKVAKMKEEMSRMTKKFERHDYDDENDMDQQMNNKDETTMLFKED